MRQGRSVFLQQAGTWLEFDQWPPPAIVPTAYYLRASGRLALAAEAGDAPPDTFVYHPPRTRRHR